MSERWSRVTLTWTRGGHLPWPARIVICRSDAEPTQSGRPLVLFDHDDDGRLAGLTAAAPCDLDGEDAIADLLMHYGRLGPDRLLVDVERCCLHDSAFAIVHDARCALVSLDRLAEALAVEVNEVLLAVAAEAPTTRVE